MRFDCQECGANVEARDYHPYLYCELVKLGHRDPAAYLRSYGFERDSGDPSAPVALPKTNRRVVRGVVGREGGLGG